MAVYLADVPEELQVYIDEVQLLGSKLLHAERYNDAFQVFQQLHERLLDSQPPGRRYHKGLPLHNMGLARSRAGAHREAMRWTLLAFIEDAVSRAEESDYIAIELTRPAAQNLRLYGMTEADLYGLAERVRKHVDRHGLVADPTAVFVREHLDEVIDDLMGRLLRANGSADRSSRVEGAPVHVRLHLPFVQVATSVSMPPIGVAGLISASLFAVAAASAVGLFWVSGLLETHWRVVLAIGFAGILVTATIVLLLRALRGTAASRAVMHAMRLIAAHLAVPLIVAVLGGLAVAYLTGGWAP